jgi:hypothetical protein
LQNLKFKTAVSCGWFNELESTPVVVFWETAEREMSRKKRRNLSI